MADAIKTMGATIAKVATPVINLTDISRGGTAGGLMDCTNLSSTAGNKEYATSGVFEQGEITIAFNWDPSAASHIALVADWQAGTAAAYTVTFSNSDTFVADLIPTAVDWANTLADDGKLEATATLKLDGTGITDPS